MRWRAMALLLVVLPGAGCLARPKTVPTVPAPALRAAPGAAGPGRGRRGALRGRRRQLRPRPRRAGGRGDGASPRVARPRDDAPLPIARVRRARRAGLRGADRVVAGRRAPPDPDRT